METELVLAAVYERTVRASLERVWENVHDWEHLPWLHSGAFSAIELLEAGEWGWRARLKIPPTGGPRELVVELRRDSEQEFYHTRTLEGPGTGTDILTRLSARSDGATDIHVEFWLPEQSEAIAEAMGKGMVDLYTRLWDEDEAMMRGRQEFLDRRRQEKRSEAPSICEALGSWNDLLARLPVLLSAGGREYRLVAAGDEILAHSTTCPHRGGPLGAAEIVDGHVQCPWHGYRFSLLDGSELEHHRCRMPTAPRVVRGADGEAQLVLSADFDA